MEEQPTKDVQSQEEARRIKTKKAPKGPAYGPAPDRRGKARRRGSRMGWSY